MPAVIYVAGDDEFVLANCRADGADIHSSVASLRFSGVRQIYKHRIPCANG
jgi:hypothetical protein